SLDIRSGGCLYLVVVVNVGPALLFPILARLGVIRDWATSALFLAAYFGVALVGVPLIAHVRRVRRLARAGYQVEDVLAGARADMEQKKEELAFTVGREVSPLERILPRLGWAGLAVAVAGIGVLVSGIIPILTAPLVPTLAVAGLALWVLGLAVGQRRRDVMGERRVKYWGSRFGRWLFKLAGAGGAPHAIGAGATHRPTELALAFAAEDLYDELPREIRAALPDLPAVLQRLEQQARAVRARIEQLEQSLADARQDTAHGAAADHRESLLNDLIRTRDQARERLSESVAALETIRLDLLRLRAGAGGVDRITADLAAAGEIGATVDRLLAAGEEIERSLK
ncbi:MAG TPA: hypothetical protein VF187_05070, partial [Gemmatimonadales bacterium]